MRIRGRQSRAKTPSSETLAACVCQLPAGPWSDVTEPFSRDWVEGPFAIRMGPEWWIYFDHYARPQKYGAIRTRDWKIFEDVSDQVNFPDDHRHGTVVRISEATARKLHQLSSSGKASSMFPGQPPHPP